MPQLVELAKIYRGNEIESIHYGIAVLAKANQIEKSWGDEKFSCFTRSIIKPIQAKVSKDILGEELSGASLAIACSSHTAELEQISQVKALMNRYSIQESDLYCGIHSSGSKQLKSPIENNCSGKHSAMIAACKKQGWDCRHYFESNHPLQEAITAELKRLLGSQSSIPSGIDGCGLPTYFLSLSDMAKIFASMINDTAYKEITQAMQDYPELIGGKKQIDTLLMQNSNKLIAKGGAEGLMLIANLSNKEALVIKIIDGSSRCKAASSLAFAEGLGWIEKNLIKIDDAIYNTRNDKVGKIEACYQAG